MTKLNLIEISEKYKIGHDHLIKINSFLFDALLIRIKGEYRPIDDSENVNKIIAARPRLSGSLYKSAFNYNYQSYLQTSAHNEPHPIQRISFKLESGEILTITDQATIEGIRQGLEVNEKHIIKTDARKAHRPKSQKKAKVKKAIELTLSFAPDGSDNSKYLFVGNIFADMGYVKNYEAWDNDPGGYANYNEYLTSFIKNALLH
jgi:hypothetical protein